MAKTDVKVRLVGEDGNAFAVLAKVSRALKTAGYEDLAAQFKKEALKGDYGHLLATACEYVVVS